MGYVFDWRLDSQTQILGMLPLAGKKRIGVVWYVF